MSNKLVITFDCNWADEFDMRGLCVMERQQWEGYVEAARKWFDANPDKECEIGFGTNEAFTFESFEEWRHCFEEKDVTDDEAAALCKFADWSQRIGYFPDSLRGR